MFTKTFWIDALERALKTAAQFAVVVIGGTAINDPVMLLTLNWLMIGQAVGLGFIVSILTSLASTLIGEKGTASLVE